MAIEGGVRSPTTRTTAVALEVAIHKAGMAAEAAKAVTSPSITTRSCGKELGTGDGGLGFRISGVCLCFFNSDFPKQATGLRSEFSFMVELRA